MYGIWYTVPLYRSLTFWQPSGLGRCSTLSWDSEIPQHQVQVGKWLGIHPQRNSCILMSSSKILVYRFQIGCWTSTWQCILCTFQIFTVHFDFDCSLSFALQLASLACPLLLWVLLFIINFQTIIPFQIFNLTIFFFFYKHKYENRVNRPNPLLHL